MAAEEPSSTGPLLDSEPVGVGVSTVTCTSATAVAPALSVTLKTTVIVQVRSGVKKKFTPLPGGTTCSLLLTTLHSMSRAPLPASNAAPVKWTGVPANTVRSGPALAAGGVLRTVIVE